MHDPNSPGLWLPAYFVSILPMNMAKTSHAIPGMMDIPDYEDNIVQPNLEGREQRQMLE
jgi:hypothetical protein